MNHLHPSKRKLYAFTLVETLVAIAILTLAVTGPYQAIENAIVQAYTARDQLIASSLAQEGIEYVYQIRDSNYEYNLSGGTRNWLASLDGTAGSTSTFANCYGTDGCIVDPTQNTVAACSGNCTPLNMSTTNLYTQATPVGYVSTAFTRTILLTSVSDTETQVTSTVSWTTRNVPYSIVITDSLRNWQ